MLTFCRYMRINIFIRHRAHPDEQQRARLKGGKDEVNHRGKIESQVFLAPIRGQRLRD